MDKSTGYIVLLAVIFWSCGIAAGYYLFSVKAPDEATVWCGVLAAFLSSYSQIVPDILLSEWSFREKRIWLRLTALPGLVPTIVFGLRAASYS